MLSRLDEEMRAHQVDADGDTELLFRPDAQPAHYLLYLTRLYGFVAPLECALEMTPGIDRMIDLRDRAKAKHIVTDLLSLGLRPAALAEMPMCLTVPQFRGVAEAVGWMYVIERQTLMHGILRRHLATCMPCNTVAATTFLGNYDGVTGERWRELGALIDTIAAPSYAIADRIVQATAEGYVCMRRWSGRDLEVGTPRRAVQRVAS
jgi:heme oxygenase